MSQIVSPDSAGEYLLTPEELAETRRLLLGLERSLFENRPKEEEGVLQYLARAIPQDVPRLLRLDEIAQSKGKQNAELLEAWVAQEQMKTLDRITRRISMEEFYELPHEMAGYTCVAPIKRYDARIFGKIGDKVRLDRFDSDRTRITAQDVGEGQLQVIDVGAKFGKPVWGKFTNYWDLTSQAMEAFDSGFITMLTKAPVGCDERKYVDMIRLGYAQSIGVCQTRTPQGEK